MAEEKKKASEEQQMIQQMDELNRWLLENKNQHAFVRELMNDCETMFDKRLKIIWHDIDCEHIKGNLIRDDISYSNLMVIREKFNEFTNMLNEISIEYSKKERELHQLLDQYRWKYGRSLFNDYL